MCEANVRTLISENECDIKPNEDLSEGGKSPDFLCQKNGQLFYVEATCISISKATRKTRLPHLGNSRIGTYTNLNEAIFAECCQKTPQCACLKYPTLLAVGTHHFEASRMCVQKTDVQMLLTGQPKAVIDIEVQTGKVVEDPYWVSTPQSAAFFAPDNDGGIGYARSPLSGIVVCGFGWKPWKILGLVHPKAAREIDPYLFPSIEFGRLRQGRETEKGPVEWV